METEVFHGVDSLISPLTSDTLFVDSYPVMEPNSFVSAVIGEPGDDQHVTQMVSEDGTNVVPPPSVSSNEFSPLQSDFKSFKNFQF